MSLALHSQGTETQAPTSEATTQDNLLAAVKVLTADLRRLLDLQTGGHGLAADARRLGALLGMSLRAIRAADASGKLPRPVRIGGRVMWPIDELKAWLAAGAPDRTAWEAQHNRK